jgi:uncharacterized protein YecT (DUF1311 family)
VPRRDPTEPPADAPPDAPVAGRAPDGTADFPPELQPLAGRYTLLRELGRGGMAVVYHARERTAHGGAADLPPGREVAIKVVSPRYTGDAEAVRRFEREARTVAGLDHPNIVRVLGIEALDEGAVAIVTRYVPGETLRDALRAEGGPIAFGRAARVLRDLAAALAHAHARRVVHRDVKPENVFLEDGTGRALLADFGIARRLDGDSPLTIDGSAFGTPTYMAPEQITGRAVDERSDVYALGLVGWEMLAGRRPWQGETLYAVLHRQQHDELPDLALLRPDIPAYLLAAIEGALAKDPAGRWRDGAEFLTRLTPEPVALPALPAGSGEADGGASQTMRMTPEATQAVAVPRDAERSVVGARPARARRQALVAALAAAVGLGGLLVARQYAESSRRAQDAAVTGVTDAQLDSLLRAAAAAAPGTAIPAPAAAPGRSAAPAPRAPAARRPTPPPRRTGAAAAAAPAAAPAASPAAAPPAAGSEVRVVAGEDTDDARCRSPAADDQRACLLAAIERTDDGLTRDYQALIAELRRRAGGAREPQTVASQRAEQRSWIDARDRQCRAALAGRDGALWGAARAPCFAALSERRATELRGRLARIVAGDSS